jgi:hypothetical protein
MNLLALANILRSNIKYVLITTYPNGKNMFWRFSRRCRPA